MSDVYRNVADLLDLLDAHGYDVSRSELAHNHDNSNADVARVGLTVAVPAVERVHPGTVDVDAGAGVQDDVSTDADGQDQDQDRDRDRDQRQGQGADNDDADDDPDRDAAADDLGRGPTDDVDDEPTEEREEPTLQCEYADCDYTTESERGLAIHQGRVHKNDPDPQSAESDDPESAADATGAIDEAAGDEGGDVDPPEPTSVGSGATGRGDGAEGAVPIPPFLDRCPREIVAAVAPSHSGEAPITLEEIVEAAANYDNPAQIRQRIGATSLPAVTEILAALGVWTSGGTPRANADERLEALRAYARASGDADAAVAETDGEAVAVASPPPPEPFRDWSADPGTRPQCGHCGHHLPKDFIRVFEPDSEPEARACPNCGDVIREGDGTIREERTGARE